MINSSKKHQIYKLLFLSLMFFMSYFFNNKSFAVPIDGYIALDNRYFLTTPSFQEQEPNHYQTSALLDFESYYNSKNNNHKFTIHPFIRLGEDDDGRNHVDLRQLDWLYKNKDIELNVGISKKYWGVMESKHLVDIINQSDILENIDDDAKLGQPMLSFTKYLSHGSLNFLYLPYFRSQEFPKKQDRLRNLLVDDNLEQYDSSAKKWYPSFALRYDVAIEDFDIGLSYFHGTGKDPRFILSQDLVKIIPYYDIIDQLGADIQYSLDSILLKLEYISRFGQKKRFDAFSNKISQSVATLIPKAIFRMELNYTANITRF